MTLDDHHSVFNAPKSRVVRTVELLLRAGASREIQGPTGQTALIRDMIKMQSKGPSVQEGTVALLQHHRARGTLIQEQAPNRRI